MRLLLLCLSLSLSLAALARAETIYRYLDDNGGVTYTNIPSSLPKKGVEKIDIPTPPNSALIPAPPTPGTRPKPSAAPANFPKVDRDTQRQRDQSRRQILQDELESESKLLDEAKKALAEGEATRKADERNYQKYLDRVQKLKDTVTLHTKNVDALKKEIAALK